MLEKGHGIVQRLAIGHDSVSQRGARELGSRPLFYTIYIYICMHTFILYVNIYLYSAFIIEKPAINMHVCMYIKFEVKGKNHDNNNRLIYSQGGFYSIFFYLTSS